MWIALRVMRRLAERRRCRTALSVRSGEGVRPELALSRVRPESSPETWIQVWSPDEFSQASSPMVWTGAGWSEWWIDVRGHLIPLGRVPGHRRAGGTLTRTVAGHPPCANSLSSSAAASGVTSTKVPRSSGLATTSAARSTDGEAAIGRDHPSTSLVGARDRRRSLGAVLGAALAFDGPAIMEVRSDPVLV